jgi:NADPH2:quinone reductase
VWRFLANLRPGGKRTALYSIQWLARRHPAWYREDLSTLLELLASAKIAPHIAATCTLDEVPEALRSLQGHGPPGKQVVTFQVA